MSVAIRGIETTPTTSPAFAGEERRWLAEEDDTAICVLVWEELLSNALVDDVDKERKVVKDVLDGTVEETSILFGEEKGVDVPDFDVVSIELVGACSAASPVGETL